MSCEDPFATEQQYKCFGCGEIDQPVDWYLGLDPNDPIAQAHYVCQNCKPMLVDCQLISVNGIEADDFVQFVGETERCHRVACIEDDRSLLLFDMPGVSINPNLVFKIGERDNA